MIVYPGEEKISLVLLTQDIRASFLRKDSAPPTPCVETVIKLGIGQIY